MDNPALIQSGLAQQHYICNEATAMTLYLALKLEKPILVEGPPGVGKTELAKAMAAVLKRSMIRLQCYEGLDEAKALYEWKYGKQLLYTQILKDKLNELLGSGENFEQTLSHLHKVKDIFYSPDFLEPRPLLAALQTEQPCVLLIDEIDKADHEFESLLLELLADFQISVPEIGTMTALHKPLVLLTSNNNRELSDALKRRCLHLYLPFPTIELESAIIEHRVPGIKAQLRQQLVKFVHELRQFDLKKQPAISETLDWARTLLLLQTDELTPETTLATLNVLLKHQEDIHQVEDQLMPLFKALDQHKN